MQNIFKANNGYFIVNKKLWETTDPYAHYNIEYYDNAQRAFTKTADWPRNYDASDPVGLNNNVYTIAALFNKEAASYDLFAKRYGADGSEDEPVKIWSYPVTRLVDRGRFRTASSPDGAKLFIIYEPDFIKNENEKIAMICLDNKLQKIWETEKTLPYKWTRGVLNKPMINNLGTAFIVKNVEAKGFDDLYTVFSYNGTVLGEHVIAPPTEKKKIAEILHKFNDAGDLIGGGYYGVSKVISTSKAPEFKGYFTTKVNADGTGPESAVVAMADFKNSRNDLKILNVLTHNNGIVLLGEVLAEMGMEPSPLTYTAKEIYITATDAAGTLLYETEIKREFFNIPQAYKPSLSFVSGIINNSIFLLFKDYEYKYDGSKKAVVFAPKQLPVLAVLNAATGKPAFTALYNTEGPEKNLKYPDVSLNHDVYLPLGNSKFLIRAENGRYYKMAQLSFN